MIDFLKEVKQILMIILLFLGYLGNGENIDGVLVDNDVNEPTMGEKLASLNLIDANSPKNTAPLESSPAKPPSADSVNILLKQALQADDRALLLECLYTQDQKVAFNFVVMLTLIV